VRIDTTVTTTDGHFTVKIPIVIDNDNQDGFYDFTVNAEVTDLSGESQSGELSLPFSTKATMFDVQTQEKFEKQQQKIFTFTYKNAAGEDVDKDVTYRIDEGTNVIVPANKKQTFPDNLKSGRHQLFAVCGQDTLTKSFIVFSLKDKQPVTKTHDWFYQSANSFSGDDKPVFIQIGSSDEEQYIYYTIFNKDTVIEEGVIQQSNAVNTRSFKYKDVYGDGIRITYAWMKDGKFYEHSAVIRKPLPDDRLILKWTTFRDRLIPGQKEEWTLHVARPDGKPVKSQLMATLYDKSLDQISAFNWLLNNHYQIDPLGTEWYSNRAKWYSSDDIRINIYADITIYKTLPLSFSKFNELFLDEYSNVDNSEAPVLYEKVSLDFNSARENKQVMNNLRGKSSGLVDRTGSVSNVKHKADKSISSPIRQNFNETAFFYPALETDEKGDVKLKFTLPESVTTWRFIGIAHDKTMNHGQLESEAVAQKAIMVQPNMPRFLREDDEAVVSSKLVNTSDHCISGVAKLELIDPQTNALVYNKVANFNVEAGQTGNLNFAVSGMQPNVYICRITAGDKDYSDGEQHYLPVLSDREFVTATYPFTQIAPGKLSVNLKDMVTGKEPGKVDGKVKYTLEYTNHPTWLAIQALPTVANPFEKDAFSLVSAYYANSIANSLLNQFPHIKKVISQWKNDKDSSSLHSALEKDAELKQLVLNETPWMIDADREARQKALLIDYFDEDKIQSRLKDQLEKLQQLQNGDGSWSWWPGMPGSLYTTVSVSETLVRLNKMLGTNLYSGMLARAFHQMTTEMKKEVKELRKDERKGVKGLRPSETAVDYLYLCALDGRKLDADDKADLDYLVQLLSKQTTELTIYGKARTAVILAMDGYMKKAGEYLQSIREYMVYKEEMGRYFDTRKAYYSWRDYKIPTQVAALEALKLLQPDDLQTITEMQRWLLQTKRTQAWDTPVNTVNAVWALMDNGKEKTDLSDLPNATFMADDVVLSKVDATAGIGYVKTVIDNPNAKVLSIDKTSSGISWGAVYAQYMQKSSDMVSATKGLQVTRTLLNQKGNLKVGDCVTVRITIVADRDYDFVQVVDKRAACLEPVDQKSSYNWEYYYAPHDQVTNYYFDNFRKGKHVVETEYYIDREGVYQSGSCTAQCAYAPEYMGRVGGSELKVER
jgi:hypothetical protein